MKLKQIGLTFLSTLVIGAFPFVSMAGTCDHSKIVLKNDTGEKLNATISVESGYLYHDSNQYKSGQTASFVLSKSYEGEVTSAAGTKGNAHFVIKVSDPDNSKNYTENKATFITDDWAGNNDCVAGAIDVGSSGLKSSASTTSGATEGSAKVELTISK